MASSWRGAVGGHARRAQPGGLGLHRDDRDVVRHDVVELAGDAGALAASLVLEVRRGHALAGGAAGPARPRSWRARPAPTAAVVTTATATAGPLVVPGSASANAAAR